MEYVVCESVCYCLSPYGAKIRKPHTELSALVSTEPVSESLVAEPRFNPRFYYRRVL
jgi:hypothetical protein